ncbi:O-antigen translocase [Aliarcobacter butzleri]|uniref:O-antigen translocase n=1 Tax=Aliarcobacter butzleri TaxID=28197 RepID=UPI0021B41F5F|nr:O-antigen translocase [Aliarcobacter butzleri]MCT7557139.1 O-antigen translocase [Aliarcobacter butzleri]MCT7622143.1 O-antigen translocase [Aliarcobacter butzleri]MCT7633546.1 O-antigen translocase [Aliarcobacter butzleri]
MTLIKTSVLTAISTIIKVVSAFVINKVIAIYVGPSGLAIVGQLQNFMELIVTFSNGAISNGIVKYTAEYQTIEQKQKIFSSSIVISLVCSLIISIFLFGFSDYLSKLILKDVQYSSVFIVFGLTIFLFALNTVLMSILNGQKEIKKYILVNIASSIFSLFFTSFLIMQLNLMGALYALVVNQSVIFFVTLVFVVKSNWFKLEYFKQGLDKESLSKLSRYSLMAITSALTVPVSHLIIRNNIGENLGWDSAGYWQGIWYISTMYLMIITTSLGVYYLPRLSEIQDNNELKKEIFNGYRIIMPIVIIMSILIFLLKEYIILVAFSDKFMPMMELFKWQLIGDVIKIASWLLAYLMLAKAMTKIFVYTEIGFSILFVLLSIWFLNVFGLVGITYAFSLNYLFYLITMIFIFRKRFI